VPPRDRGACTACRASTQASSAIVVAQPRSLLAGQPATLWLLSSFRACTTRHLASRPALGSRTQRPINKYPKPSTRSPAAPARSPSEPGEIRIPGCPHRGGTASQQSMSGAHGAHRQLSWQRDHNEERFNTQTRGRVAHPAAASPPSSYPQGDGHRGRASTYEQGGVNGATGYHRHPRRPCH
jgi:hypothetical protein